MISFLLDRVIMISIEHLHIITPLLLFFNVILLIHSSIKPMQVLDDHIKIEGGKRPIYKQKVLVVLINKSRRKYLKKVNWKVIIHVKREMSPTHKCYCVDLKINKKLIMWIKDITVMIFSLFIYDSFSVLTGREN